MSRPPKLKITDLNPYLSCILCGGYFIDATTITECLHSFCRACIVRYLETSKYCPVCEVQVHKSRPLHYIRSDKTLQDIVYKLVPGLFHNEMKRRRELYASQPPEALLESRDAEDRGECLGQKFIYAPDEIFSLSIEYAYGREDETEEQREEETDDKAPKRRFLRCPAAVTVAHLKKFIRMKYGISSAYEIDLRYGKESLFDEYTLIDVAYIYLWRRSGPMRFFYKILERPRKKLKTQQTSEFENVAKEEAPPPRVEVTPATPTEPSAPAPEPAPPHTKDEGKVEEGDPEPPVVTGDVTQGHYTGISIKKLPPFKISSHVLPPRVPPLKLSPPRFTEGSHKSKHHHHHQGKKAEEKGSTRDAPKKSKKSHDKGKRVDDRQRRSSHEGSSKKRKDATSKRKHSVEKSRKHEEISIKIRHPQDDVKKVAPTPPVEKVAPSPVKKLPEEPPRPSIPPSEAPKDKAVAPREPPKSKVPEEPAAKKAKCTKLESKVAELKNSLSIPDPEVDRADSNPFGGPLVIAEPDAPAKSATITDDDEDEEIEVVDDVDSGRGSDISSRPGDDDVRSPDPAKEPEPVRCNGRDDMGVLDLSTCGTGRNRAPPVPHRSRPVANPAVLDRTRQTQPSLQHHHPAPPSFKVLSAVLPHPSLAGSGNFKCRGGTTLTVINPDPDSCRPKIVIRNVDARPDNGHSRHHHHHHHHHPKVQRDHRMVL